MDKKYNLNTPERRKRTKTPANMAIDVLVVDLIPANPIELFGNRAQAYTNRSGEEFNYQTQTNTNHRLSCILLVD